MVHCRYQYVTRKAVVGIVYSVKLCKLSPECNERDVLK